MLPNASNEVTFFARQSRHRRFSCHFSSARRRNDGTAGSFLQATFRCSPCRGSLPLLFSIWLNPSVPQFPSPSRQSRILFPEVSNVETISIFVTVLRLVYKVLIADPPNTQRCYIVSFHHILHYNPLWNTFYPSLFHTCSR